MKKTLLVVLLLILGIAGVTLWRSFRTPPPGPVTERQAVPEPEKPEVRHPIAKVEPKAAEVERTIGLEKPLPELGESDNSMREVLGLLFAGENLETFFVLDNFIQRFVAMVDNLPRPDLPRSLLPTRPVHGKFLVAGEERNPAIDPANFKRYTPLVGLVESVDSKKAVAVYVHFYPLFQEAYERLGNPDSYFNDRLIEVIDHLLATPEVSGQIRLVRPKIYYRFADPSLEGLSAGRKVLIRSGPENAARIKGILRSYRSELTEVSEGRP